MFSLYDTLFNKIAFTVFLFVMRMALFFHCQTHPPVYVLTGIHILIIQILNTVVFFVVASVICISFSSNLQKAEQHLMLYNIELQQQAGTDPLTTLYNRRRMEEVLKNHIRANPNENFSIAIGDIDFFKKINDTYGHNCGDYVLNFVAQKMKNICSNCVISRWGGEEFLIHNGTHDSTHEVLEKLRREIENSECIYNQQKINISLTIGVAQRNADGDIEEWIKRADDRLYYGKNNGKNMVVD